MADRCCLFALTLASSAFASHLATAAAADATAQEKPVKFARFKVDDNVAFGIVEGENVREISGTIFGDWKETDKVHALSDVTLMVPTRPRHVFAMAGNYKSHLERSRGPAQVPHSPAVLQEFFIADPARKPDRHSQRRDRGSPLRSRDGGRDRQTSSQVSKENALDYVLGVTCGNDVSERYWQNDEENKDVQWWRAKGSDTFGPCGPFIASGLDYDDLLLTFDSTVKSNSRNGPAR